MPELTAAAISFAKTLAAPLAKRLGQLLQSPLRSKRQRKLLSQAQRELLAAKPDLDKAETLVDRAANLDTAPNPDIRRLRRAVALARDFLAVVVLMPLGFLEGLSRIARKSGSTASGRERTIKPRTRDKRKPSANKKPSPKRKPPPKTKPAPKRKVTKRKPERPGRSLTK